MKKQLTLEQLLFWIARNKQEIDQLLTEQRNLACQIETKQAILNYDQELLNKKELFTCLPIYLQRMIEETRYLKQQYQKEYQTFSVILLGTFLSSLLLNQTLATSPDPVARLTGSTLVVTSFFVNLLQEGIFPPITYALQNQQGPLSITKETAVEQKQRLQIKIKTDLLSLENQVKRFQTIEDVLLPEKRQQRIYYEKLLTCLEEKLNPHYQLCPWDIEKMIGKVSDERYYLIVEEGRLFPYQYKIHWHPCKEY